MPIGANRALQVRAAQRVRARLARDETSGLPAIAALSEADQRELSEVGGGRIAAVVIRVRSRVIAGVEEQPSHRAPSQVPVQVLTVREVARVVDAHVRRSDLLGSLREDTLLVLAPGLDGLGSQSLAARLLLLLTRRQIDVAGVQVEVHVAVGAAYRHAASPSGWTTRALAAEAELHATEPPSSEHVA